VGAVPAKSQIRSVAVTVALLVLALREPGQAASSGRPWWREAAELPEDALDVMVWPLKKGVIWAEDVNLPDRVLDTLYFDEQRTAGWFPNFSFGGEIQSALGIRLFHRNLLGGGERIDFATLAATNDLEERRVSLSFNDPSISGSRWWTAAEIDYVADNDEDFFVRQTADGRLHIGADTGPHDDTTYALDRVRSRFELGLQALPGLRIGAALRPLYGNVETGGGAEIPIPRAVDGFGGPVVLLGGESLVEYDGRDSSLRPHSGWYTRAAGGAWTGVEGETTNGRDYRYARYTVDLRRHQPTFRSDRSIVLRAVLDRVETLDGAVPFWELPTLDEDHALRGFPRNRFRERGSLLFNAEYRYPIWDTWDGFVFADEGQVFHRYSDVSIGGFEWSAGGGVLVFTETSFVLRLQYAVSEEENLFRFDLSQAF
jgi:outer membrane protein assembly factor BamA